MVKQCFFLPLLLVLPLCAQKPNVVVIISDDAGYSDWGFMDDYLQTLNPGQPKSTVPTPNLDALRTVSYTHLRAHET